MGSDMPPLRLTISLLAVFPLISCATLRPSGAQFTKSHETNNPRRLVTLHADDFERAHGILPIADDLSRVGEDEEGRTVTALTFAVQAEWLRTAGIEVLEERTQIPRALIDDSFQARRGLPPPRDERDRLRTDDGYHDAAMVEALLQAFAEDHPEITRLHEIGRSWQDRPVLAMLITDHPDIQEDEPAVLFNGTHHGSELLSMEPVLDIIEQLTRGYEEGDERVRRWVDGLEIWCVPVVNPDGLDRHWFVTSSSGRNNCRDLDGDGEVGAREGVDLNRNYPFLWGEGGKGASNGEPHDPNYRGPSPGSEPETQAMMSLADAQRFVLGVSYHTAATTLLVPYTIDKALSPHPSAAWAMAREIAPLMDSDRATPYRVRRHLYAVDGTDQDWHMFAHGTEAFLLELPLHNPDYEERRNPIVEGARPLWQSLIDRIGRGPTLSGHVRDAMTGEPLEAAVSLDEIQWFHGEVHTAHPETGRFDRILPASGIFHVRAAHPGHHTVVVEVEVGEEQRFVDIALPPLIAGD
jgi:Zinc carboxypeptidase